MKINTERLKTLADHLATLNLPPGRTQISDDATMVEYEDYYECTISYFYFVLLELPNLFPQWKLDELGAPVWDQDEISTSISSALMFFQISWDQFQHCLIPGLQDTKRYGGNILTKNSSPVDICVNILALIEKEEGT